MAKGVMQADGSKRTDIKPEVYDAPMMAIPTVKGVQPEIGGRVRMSCPGGTPIEGTVRGASQGYLMVRWDDVNYAVAVDPNLWLEYVG